MEEILHKGNAKAFPHHVQITTISPKEVFERPMTTKIVELAFCASPTWRVVEHQDPQA